MKFTIYTLLGALVGSIGAWQASQHLGAAAGDFFWNIKSELFGGLFTISGLLLSVKTYIVVKLKEGIYSKDSYISDYVMLAEEGKTPDDDHFAPLWRLSSALTTAVAVAAVAALMQLVAACYARSWGPILGFGAGGAAVASLAFCWNQIRTNLNKYFEFLRRDSKAQVMKAREEYRHSKENPPKFEE